MRWQGRRRSTRVEDRRGRRTSAVPGGVKIGGGLGLVLIVVVLLLGGDPSELLGLLQQQSSPTSSVDATPRGVPAGDQAAEFISVVLASTEDTWSQLFGQAGVTYQPPSLVLFDDAVQSACGFNSAATGPFYCPGDSKVYMDLGFFRELEALGAPGDFAQAYVVGHEIGHHIQNPVGTNDRVRQLQSRLGGADVNRVQVLMELQADCYAGVWAHHANKRQQLLEPGDVEEGLGAAAAIGDDRLLRRAGRRVSPESFTHGSSAQRQQWLSTGLRTGNLDACDTFGAAGI